MRITQVMYRRLYNLGNYETEAVELVASVDDGEEHRAVLDQLAKEAAAWHASRPSGRRSA